MDNKQFTTPPIKTITPTTFLIAMLLIVGVIVTANAYADAPNKLQRVIYELQRVKSLVIPEGGQHDALEFERAKNILKLNARIKFEVREALTYKTRLVQSQLDGTTPPPPLKMMKKTFPEFMYNQPGQYSETINDYMRYPRYRFQWMKYVTTLPDSHLYEIGGIYNQSRITAFVDCMTSNHPEGCLSVAGSKWAKAPTPSKDVIKHAKGMSESVMNDFTQLAPYLIYPQHRKSYLAYRGVEDDVIETIKDGLFTPLQVNVFLECVTDMGLPDPCIEEAGGEFTSDDFDG